MPKHTLDNDTTMIITPETQNKTITFHSDCTNIRNFSNPSQNIFHDDICFEIMSFLDSGFIVKSCVLDSKQWFKVVIECISLSLSINTKLDEETINLISRNRFLHNIITLNFKERIISKND